MGHNLILIYTREPKKKKNGNHFDVRKKYIYKTHREISVLTDQKYCNQWLVYLCCALAAVRFGILVDLARAGQKYTQ